MKKTHPGKTESWRGPLRSALSLHASAWGWLIFALAPHFSWAQQTVSPEVIELREGLKVSQQQVAALQQQNEALKQSVAEATRVSEEQLLKATQLQEKLEALGVDLLAPGRDNLEQRLLKAVRDLDIMRQESERQRKAVHQLSEAFLKYLAATEKAPQKDREEASRAITAAGDSLRDLSPREDLALPLERSQVVSFDDKLGLVVVNAGRKSGVRVGTPIMVDRADRPIYTALIVDVREAISGALLQEDLAKAGPVKVGDQVRPLATQKQF